MEATVKTYKPRDIQERTFAFAVDIVKLTDKLPRSVSGVEIGKQLLRAGTSVGANVREADAAESHRDFVHKIAIAEKEIKETRYWLELIRETILPQENQVALLLAEADQLAKILYTIGRRTRTRSV